MPTWHTRHWWILVHSEIKFTKYIHFRNDKCLTTIAFILFLEVASSSGASSDDDSECIGTPLATHIETLACFNDSLNCWLINQMTKKTQLQLSLHLHLCARVFHLMKYSAESLFLFYLFPPPHCQCFSIHWTRFCN